VFYSFSSFTYPPAVYRYDIATRQSTVFRAPAIPHFDPGAYETRQVFYTSKDGTRVPMFLVHRKGLRLDGTNPALLYGYGGFNIVQRPAFNVLRLALVEQGFVYAVANLRGGGEYGEAWHEAGTKLKKQNVFDDFIAAAEWLIAEGYTRPERLTISGGSNGGLLVGAALTQRPDLFRAVLCAVPLLDMLRYHLFLVARFWVPEYGSAEDPEQFRYLLRYSPYHNVREGVIYPAVLFSTGDSDTRVAPLHARKMCALLQHVNPPDRPVLLDYDTASGHAGGKPLSERIKEFAREMAFLFWQIGADLK
jgi:prolyl oligopeptidase